MGLAKINVGGTWKNMQTSSSSTTTCSCSGGCTNGCSTACQSICGGGAKTTVVQHVKTRVLGDVKVVVTQRALDALTVMEHVLISVLGVLGIVTDVGPNVTLGVGTLVLVQCRVIVIHAKQSVHHPHQADAMDVKSIVLDALHHVRPDVLDLVQDVQVFAHHQVKIRGGIPNHHLPPVL